MEGKWKMKGILLLLLDDFDMKGCVIKVDNKVNERPFD
jgi:hypothetical protein